MPREEVSVASVAERVRGIVPEERDKAGRLRTAASNAAELNRPRDPELLDVASSRQRHLNWLSEDRVEGAGHDLAFAANYNTAFPVSPMRTVA
jgi:hypothetical protein